MWCILLLLLGSLRAVLSILDMLHAGCAGDAADGEQTRNLIILLSAAPRTPTQLLSFLELGAQFAPRSLLPSLLAYCMQGAVYPDDACMRPANLLKV
jgi:hypothetical protein